MKDPMFYSNISSGQGSIINANQERHGLLRKQASHGFSERAMRSQEYIIRKCIELMVQRFEECIETGKPTVDIVDWYNVSALYQSCWAMEQDLTRAVFYV